MKVLSLTQPWATLMALGHKHYETRSWSTQYRGLLAIHASKGFPRDCQALLDTEPFIAALRDTPVLRLGEIVAVVELLDCVATTRRPFDVYPRSAPPAPYEESFGDYSAGRFAWLTRYPRALKTPIAAKGSLGLWEFSTEEIEAAIDGR